MGAITSALEAGYRAAAWGVRTAGDGRGGNARTWMGEGSVEARVVLSEGAGPGVVPLASVSDRVLGGDGVSDIQRPDPSLLFWEGVAIVPVLDSGCVVVIHARDYRGLGSAILGSSRVAGGEEFGAVMARRLLSSSIAGQAGRARKAAERMGEEVSRPGDDLRAVVAGAVTEYLGTRASGDGGPAVSEWSVIAFSSEAGAHVLAGSAPGGDGSRRGRLNDAVVRALEVDAFGSGVHSPRSAREVVPLDPERDRGEDFAAAVEDRLWRDDLFARADLSERERDAFDLRHVEGLTERETADRMGCRPGTVKSLTNRARQKLKKAAGM